MTKKKKPTVVGTAEVRRWLSDISKSPGSVSYGICKAPECKSPLSGMSYATNGYIIGFCGHEIGEGSGPANAAFLKGLDLPGRINSSASFRALRAFANTAKRKPEPVRLFGICVDRVLLNRLLRKAPPVDKVVVGTRGETDPILIQSEKWTAYIMPYLGTGRMPSFSRTVRK